MDRGLRWRYCGGEEGMADTVVDLRECAPAKLTLGWAVS